jgi:hypothetical protein
MTLGYQAFKIIIVLTSIYSSLLYAVLAAFRLDLDYETYDEYLEESPDARINPITLAQIKYYNLAYFNLEAVFLSAMCINCITSYTDPDNGNEVKDI